MMIKILEVVVERLNSLGFNGHLVIILRLELHLRPFMKEREGTWGRFWFHKLLHIKNIILKTKQYENRKRTGLLAPP
jgi:hypothetical protein